jgi:hypothetical protein
MKSTLCESLIKHPADWPSTGILGAEDIRNYNIIEIYTVWVNKSRGEYRILGESLRRYIWRPEQSSVKGLVRERTSLLECEIHTPETQRELYHLFVASAGISAPSVPVLITSALSIQACIALNETFTLLTGPRSREPANG